MQTTFVQLLLQHAAERPQATAMREKEYGVWQALTWTDLAGMVQHIAAGLHQAGLMRGEHMIVVGANRPRLYATMLAVQALGAIPIPLYQDAAAAEWVMGRPQIQEEAVVQLADLIQQKTQPDGLAIVMEASHFCMGWRGVKDTESKMINSVMRGSFLKDANLRREFLSLIPQKG